MKEKITALVPMRHTSERVPGKNYRLFSGKPLFHYILSSLLKCREISKIVIDTDSETIIQDVEKSFPAVEVIDRPKELRGGMVPMNDILLHDAKQFPSEFYLQTHVTNPLLKSATISEAIRKFSKHYPENDSLFSVTRLQTRLWDENRRPINHNPEILLRTQDLPPVFEENSCLYIFTGKSLEVRHNRIGERPMMFEIDPEEAWDIDEESDFRIAEIMCNLHGEKQ
jgi:CMP-N-acetylneuraminic acid synthetase